MEYFIIQKQAFSNNTENKLTSDGHTAAFHCCLQQSLPDCFSRERNGTQMD